MPARRYRLAQRRKAVGFSQERLAETIGVDRSTVVRWERADTDPQAWHRPHLAAALKVSIEDLAELLADVTEPPRTNVRLDYVLKHPGKVDLVAVAWLRKQLQRLDEQYERVPSTLLLAEAAQLHGQAVFLLEQARSGPMQSALTAAVVESATLVGQLVWDASQRREHNTGVAYFDQAIAAARQVRDATGEANALLRRSYIALYGTGDPATGLALAYRAAVTARHDSHVIAGLAQLHVAEAYAMLSDARECAAALGAAETHFAHVRPDDPAGVLFSPSHHGRLAGSCWLFLGKPAKAEAVLDATRKLTTAHRKSTAIVYGNLALASIRQRNFDTAVARLHDAIDVVEQTRSGGGLNIVATAVRELRPWRTEQAVQEVNDRLLTLMTAA